MPDIAQRWAHEAPQADAVYDDDLAAEEEEVRKRQSHQPRPMHRSVAVCNSWRVLAELTLCLLVCSWLCTLFIWYHSSCSSFQGQSIHQYTQSLQSSHALISQRTGLALTVDENGYVAMAERRRDDPHAAALQHFHMEWGNTTGPNVAHFCLRSLHDLRLVEVVRPDEPEAHMLRLGRRHYKCQNASQMFAMRGRSIYSVGAQSVVNIREDTHVRAHGDVGPPWRPMQQETPRSALIFEPLALPQDELVRKLVNLVSRLES
jgi:hypothetical protein